MYLYEILEDFEPHLSTFLEHEEIFTEYQLKNMIYGFIRTKMTDEDMEILSNILYNDEDRIPVRMSERAFKEQRTNQREVVDFLKTKGFREVDVKPRTIASIHFYLGVTIWQSDHFHKFFHKIRSS